MRLFSWLLMQTQSDRVAHGGRRHRGLNTPPRGPACDGLAVGVSAEQVVVLLVVRLVVAVSSPTSHALVAFGQSSPTRRLVTEESSESTPQTPGRATWTHPSLLLIKCVRRKGHRGVGAKARLKLQDVPPGRIPPCPTYRICRGESTRPNSRFSYFSSY